MILYDIIDRLYLQTVYFELKVGINNIARNNCTIIIAQKLSDWGSFNIGVIVFLHNF